jgi:coatomer subunit beta'
MEAYEKSVNFINFYLAADKPYLVTTGDDKTLKVWDFLCKSCVQTIEAHTNNISFVASVSGSEDGTVKIGIASKHVVAISKACSIFSLKSILTN